MTVTVQPGKIAGEIAAIPSKSHLHRLLIFAALADAPTLISCRETEAEDIHATVDCLAALGAKITRKPAGFYVEPIGKKPPGGAEPVLLPCGESGSTLRFMLPVVCALGVRGAFEMKGRLPERPLAPLDAQLESHGIRLWRDTQNILQCEGQLTPGDYALPGDISSQYISGLLMALPLLGAPSKITITAPIESAGYIDMTLEAAKAFGQKPHETTTPQQTVLQITPTTFKSPGEIAAEGDWSNAAFWLCAGAMPGGAIKMRGLSQTSTQGDREILEILTRMGASVRNEATEITVTENARQAVEIDASAIPDLIPVVAAVAAAAEGTTIVRNAARLRIKESDRLESVAATLSTLGAKIETTPDGLIIRGVSKLKGGEVEAHGDHRIAMTAAIASAACENPVKINGAEAVNKSYPQFWNDLRVLGKNIN